MASKYQIEAVGSAPALIALTNHDQLRSLDISTMRINTVYIVNVGNISEQWCLVAGVNADDNANYIQPSNPDGANMWRRIA